MDLLAKKTPKKERTPRTTTAKSHNLISCPNCGGKTARKYGTRKLGKKTSNEEYFGDEELAASGLHLKPVRVNRNKCESCDKEFPTIEIYYLPKTIYVERRKNKKRNCLILLNLVIHCV